jgi:hypothetical protein
MIRFTLNSIASGTVFSYNCSPISHKTSTENFRTTTQQLYPPQDLIDWIKMTDAKNSQEQHEILKGNYRVEGRLNQPKQKGASVGIQTKDGVHIDTT